MQILYYWTRRETVALILNQGFLDATHRAPLGVHLSADPVYYRTGFNDEVIVVQLPDDLDLGQYLDPARLRPEIHDYVIPAAVLNERATFLTP